MASHTSDSDVISEVEKPTRDIDEKDIAVPGHRTKPSLGARRVSEWEALQIVAAGDEETINREIDETEADLQAMNIQSSWHKPQIKLNPRYATWLLVGTFLLTRRERHLSNLPQGSHQWVDCCPESINL